MKSKVATTSFSHGPQDDLPAAGEPVVPNNPDPRVLGARGYDEQGPDTPESNTPPPAYAGGEPEGGEHTDFPERPVEQAPRSPLENLPESVSVSDIARRSRERGSY